MLNPDMVRPGTGECPDKPLRKGRKLRSANPPADFAVVQGELHAARMADGDDAGQRLRLGVAFQLGRGEAGGFFELQNRQVVVGIDRRIAGDGKDAAVLETGDAGGEVRRKVITGGDKARGIDDDAGTDADESAGTVGLDQDHGFLSFENRGVGRGGWFVWVDSGFLFGSRCRNRGHFSLG